MRPISLRQKRLVAAIFMAALLFAAGNHYLGWGLFGQADRIALSIVMLLGVLAWVRFAPRMMEELRAENAARRAKEDALERTRDKSNDPAETEELRQAIGMPPDKSLERTRDD